jgi:hypothetical protein
MCRDDRYSIGCHRACIHVGLAHTAPAHACRAIIARNDFRHYSRPLARRHNASGLQTMSLGFELLNIPHAGGFRNPRAGNPSIIISAQMNTRFTLSKDFFPEGFLDFSR